MARGERGERCRHRVHHLDLGAVGRQDSCVRGRALPPASPSRKPHVASAYQTRIDRMGSSFCLQATVLRRSSGGTDRGVSKASAPVRRHVEPPWYARIVVGLLKPRFSGWESTGLIDEVGAWSFCCVTTARALAVSLLLTELGLSSAIAVAFEKQDLGMVGQAVDQSDGARGVGEDGVPAFEG